MLFVNIIVPVFLIIFAGFVLEKKAALDFRSLTTCSLYLFSPALIFSSLVKRPIPFQLTLDLFVYMLLYTTVLLLIAFGAARLFSFDPQTRGALCLTTVVMNSGNFGLPLAYFAFGEAGLETSILIFVLFTIPLSTLAVVVAQGPEASLGKALANTFRIPLFHAVALAFLCQAFKLPIPPFILRPVELLGQALVPLMLVLLGMQLAKTRIKLRPGFLSLATLIRLIIGPAVAWGICALIGISGTPAKVAILQTSTPSAILPLLYSLRFGTRPDLVAGTILVTTTLSALTLTVLLYLLQ